MPRPAKGPRLYLNPAERVWIIRDGPRAERTGCGEFDRTGAEKKLGAYLATKFQPSVRQGDIAQILVAEVLAAYATEHVPSLKPASIESAGYNITSLLSWWGTRTLAEVNKVNCEAYAKFRSTPRMEGERLIRAVKPVSIRRELALLAAAIGHWHGSHGPLLAVPVVALPSKSPPRDRWLERKEGALLLAGALGFYREFWSDVATRKERWHWRRYRPGINPHLARFILLGLYTGSRKAVCLSVQWMPNTSGGWVDLDRSVFYRKPPSEEETKKKKPPSRLGRRIKAHLGRWERLDARARAKEANAGNPKWTTLYRYVVTWRGKPVNSVRTAWDAAIDLAWLDKKVTPHTMRHTRATWLMQSGVDLWQAAGHMGMSAQMLEENYGKHHPNWQKEAAEV